ncbi:M20 metallopeptidase family protein [Ornithinicoccus halotolerans]|uniref:M20 metallopeptidase family protein n=1 Tax=Ornithinicoccus halotolerans TaxID=1748220 RepID=UPI001295564C|nr:M20 family metallopeptidase [Ornithinicoccus halotolerans]
MTSDSLALAARHADDVIALRRALHQVPEVGLRLPVTQQLVLDALAGLGLEVTTGAGLDSVVAVLRGGAGDSKDPQRQVVLLRGDMDGLPVTEEVDVPYRSRHEGRMHACGHDLHTAGLVGAARALCEVRDELAGDVILMFQPGEEGPGGAEPMLAEGLLDAAGAGRPVVAAYTVHVFAAEQPLGLWTARPREMMAAADTVTVTVQGRGGHGSQPHRALDPVPVLCEIVLALQSTVTRSFDVFDPVVLTVGRITAGTKDNIIPDGGELAATLRTFSAANRERAMALIERVVTGVAAAHGLAAEVGFSEGYPATVNDEVEYARGREVVEELFGPDQFALRELPEMGSEDMSFVMEQVPGAYFFLSACDAPDPQLAPSNHSPRARFDDSVLADAVAWLVEMTRRRLAG